MSLVDDARSRLERGVTELFAAASSESGSSPAALSRAKASVAQQIDDLRRTALAIRSQPSFFPEQPSIKSGGRRSLSRAGSNSHLSCTLPPLRPMSGDDAASCASSMAMSERLAATTPPPGQARTASVVKLPMMHSISTPAANVSYVELNKRSRRRQTQQLLASRTLPAAADREAEAALRRLTYGRRAHLTDEDASGLVADGDGASVGGATAATTTTVAGFGKSANSSVVSTMPHHRLTDGGGVSTVPQMETILLYTRDCLQYAAVAAERGCPSDTSSIFLSAITEDIKLLRAVASLAKDQLDAAPASRQNSVSGPQLAWGSGKKHLLPADGTDAAAVDKAHTPEEQMPLVLQALLRTAHYDILSSVNTFYQLLNRDAYLDLGAETFGEAQSCIDAVLSHLMTIVQASPVVSSSSKESYAENHNGDCSNSNVTPFASGDPARLAGILQRDGCHIPVADLLVSREESFLVEAAVKEMVLTKRYCVADAGYHLVFLGTVYVYEMCSFLLQRTQHAIRDLQQRCGSATIQFDPSPMYQHCLQCLGACVELCEANSATLKLATVKYLPWRARVYELMARCYEHLEHYQHALDVTNRSMKQATDLVEVEFLDSVPPPPSSQRTMVDVLHRTALQAMKYNWYLTLSQASTSSSDGAHASESAGNAAGGIPYSGGDLIQAIWSCLDRDYIPNANGVSPTSAQSSNASKVKRAGSDLSASKLSKKLAQQAEADAQMAQAAKRETERRRELMQHFQRHAVPFLITFLVEHTEKENAAASGGDAPTPSKPRTTNTGATSSTAARSGGGNRRGTHVQQHDVNYGELRAAAREALEIIIQSCSATYWTEHGEALVAAHELYPFALPDVNTLAPPAVEIPAGTPLEIRQQIAAEAAAQAAAAAAAANKGGKNRGGKGANNNKKGKGASSAAATPALDSSQYLAQSQSGAAGANQHYAIPGLLDDHMWGSAMLWEKLFPALLAGGAVGENTTNNTLVYPDTVQDEALRLLSLFRGLFVTTRCELYIRWCAAAMHMLRRVISQEKEKSKKRSRDRSTIKLLDTIATAIHMLQRLKYASLIIGYQASKFRMDRVFLPFTAPVADATSGFNGPTSATISEIAAALLEATTASPCITGEEECSSSTLPPYPVVGPLLGAVEALCDMADRLGGRTAVSTRMTPTAPLLASSRNATYATGCLYESIIEEVSKYLLHQADAIIRNRREQHALRDIMSVTDAPFYDPENPAVIAMPRRTEEDVDEDEERAYFRVVVRTTEALLAAGRCDALELGALAMSMATTTCEGVQIVQDGIRAQAHQQDISNQANATITDSSSSTITTALKTASKKKKKQLLHLLERARLSLFFATMAQQMVIERQDSLRAHSGAQQHQQRSGTKKGRSISRVSFIDMSSPLYNTGIDEGKVRARQFILAQQLRDSRTNLTRHIIELRWYVALLRSQTGAFRQREVDIKTLLSRQLNTAVYGVVTSKESRILRTIVEEEPDLPVTPEEEEARLLSSSMGGDPTLRTLTMVCLARLLKLQKANVRARERLDGAMDLLVRNMPRGGGDSSASQAASNAASFRSMSMASTGAAAGAGKEREKDSIYSPAIVWSFAASVCGQLGALSHANTARNVLYGWFVKDGNKVAETAGIRVGGSSEETAEPSVNQFLLIPNQAALEDSSDTVLVALCRAFYDISRVELASITSPSPSSSTGAAAASHSPSLSTSEQQFIGLRCAYRTLFALRVAQRVVGRSSTGSAVTEASSLTLSCANQMFNALLPCLSDKHFSPSSLQPLVALCYTLLGLSGSVWVDASVQLLAFRVVYSLHCLLLRIPPSSASVTTDRKNQMRFLMLRTFVHAWNQVRAHPNPRQVRYMQWVKRGVISLRQVEKHNAMIATAAGPEGVAAGTAAPNAAPEKQAGGRRRRKSQQQQQALSEDAEAVAIQHHCRHFPGNAYAPEPDNNTLIDDVMPAEYVQILEELVFSVPGALTAFMNPTAWPAPTSTGQQQQTTTTTGTRPQSMGGRRMSADAKSASTTMIGDPNPKLQADVDSLLGTSPMEGLPAIILEVGAALATMDGVRAADVLQNHQADPLYAKMAMRLADFYSRRGDDGSARRVVTTALESISQQWNKFKQHEADTFQQLRLWLISKGYIITADKQEARRASVHAAPTAAATKPTAAVAAKGPKGKPNKKQQQEQAEEEAAAKAAAEALESEKFKHVRRDWTAEEQQAIGMLTRSVAWGRRRLAYRWLRRRFFQWNGVFQAQMRVYLASIIRQEWSVSQRRHASHEEEARWGAATGLTGLGNHMSVSAAPSGASSARSGKGRGPPVPAKVEVVENAHVEVVTQTLFAARLFNRAIEPAFAFRAVQQALEDVQAFITGVIPFAHVFLLGDGSGGSGGGAGGGGGTSRGTSAVGEESDRLSFMSGCSQSNMGNGDSYTVSPQTLAQLQEVSPQLLKLTLELLNALCTVRRGYCDHRRDVEMLQPAAIKIGQFVACANQVGWQGITPSLLSFVSATGQQEEVRHAKEVKAEMQRRRRQASYWMQECAQEELTTRAVVAEVEAHERQELFENLADVVPAVQQWLAANKVEPIVSSAEEEARAAAAAAAAEANAGGPRKHAAVPNTSRTMTSEGSARRGFDFEQAQMLTYFPYPEDKDCTDQQMQQEVAVQEAQLGRDMLEELVAETLAHLMHSLQYTYPKQVVQLCMAAHTLTQGRYATLFLPLAMSMQSSMGISTRQLADVYEVAVRDAPLGANLLRLARSSWERYSLTDAYKRCRQRLARTLQPSLIPPKHTAAGVEGEWVNNTFASPEGSVMPSTVVVTKAKTVKSVLAAYQAAADRLRETRDFGSLGECLLEMGRICLLHRNKSEAERYWLESVDTLLEIPRSLQRWRQVLVPKKQTQPQGGKKKDEKQVWADVSFSPEKIGLSRILLAITALSSLAMFLYRENQTRAVDAYLLSATLLHRFFSSGISMMFPKRLYDYTAFNFQDVSILPHLGNAFSKPKVADVVHHLLYVAHELCEFQYLPHSALVAGLAEYLARCFLNQTKTMIDAQLIHARAAVQAGNIKSAMQFMSSVCRGADLPNMSLHLVASTGQKCALATAKLHASGASGNTTDKPAKKAQSNSSPTSPGLVNAQMTFPVDEGGISGDDHASPYDNAELPSSAGNTAAITTFLSQCLPHLNVEQVIAANPNVGTPSVSGSGAPSALMHGNVCEAYGSLLSRRVLLGVIEVLVAIAAKEGGTYLWPFGAVGVQSTPAARRPASRDVSGPANNKRKGWTNANVGSAVRVRCACTDALKIAEYLLELVLTNDGNANSGAAAANNNAAGAAAAGSARQPSSGPGAGERKGPAKGGSLLKKGAAGGVSADDKALLAITDNQQAEERAMLRHRALLLKALCIAGRGHAEASAALLMDQLRNYNFYSLSPDGNDDDDDNNKQQTDELAGKGFKVSAVFQLPSYLMTISHTYWCQVLLCLTSSYMRLRDYAMADRMIACALQLCEQCKDAYSIRVFVLYRASALAQRGLVQEAANALAATHKATLDLGLEGADPLGAWVMLAQSTCAALAPAASSGSGSSTTTIVVDRALIDTLKSTTLISGLLPWTPVPNARHHLYSAPAWCVPSCPDAALTAFGSLNALKVHAAVNMYTHAALRVLANHNSSSCTGSKTQAALVEVRDLCNGLRQVVEGVAAQYDTRSHPSLLLQSKLLLAQGYLLTDSLEGHAVIPDQGDPSVCTSPEATTAALATPAMRCVASLLLEVIDQCVTLGGHDYNLLLTALLELSALFARAGPRFSSVASSCLILAHLVSQMVLHVFSGTSAFYDYNSDETMTTEFAILESRFPQSVMSIVKSTLLGVGHVLSSSDDCGANANDRLAASVNPFYSEHLFPETSNPVPMGRRSSKAGRSSNSATPPLNQSATAVTVQDMVQLFATMHRERSSCDILPPNEVLDYENALIAVKGFLQEKTAPLCCTYLCYSAETRATILKQLNPQRGGPQTTTGGRGARNNAAGNAQLQQQQDALDLWSSLVPQVLLGSMPEEVFSVSGPDTLCAPRVNSVLTASFHSFRAPLTELDAARLVVTASATEPLNTTLLLCVSPLNDPTLTEAPAVGSQAERKKLLRQPEATTAAAATRTSIGSVANTSGGPPSSSAGGRPQSGGGSVFKNRLASSSFVFGKPRAIAVDAALAERIQELESSSGNNTDALVTTCSFGSDARPQWRCVNIELSSAVVHKIVGHAEHVLELMDALNVAVAKAHGASDGSFELSTAAVPVAAAAATTTNGAAAAAAGGGGANNSGKGSSKSASPAAADMNATNTTSIASGAAEASGSKALAQSLMKATQTLRQIVLPNQANAAGGNNAANNSTTNRAKGSSSGRPGTVAASSSSPQDHVNARLGAAGSTTSMNGSTGLSPRRLGGGDDTVAEEAQQQQAEQLRLAVDTLTDKLHEEQSDMLMGFVDAIIARYVPVGNVTEEVLEQCTNSILPECSMDRDVVKFLKSWLSGESSTAARFFSPAIHAWMTKVLNFVSHNPFTAAAAAHAVREPKGRRISESL